MINKEINAQNYKFFDRDRLQGICSGDAGSLNSINTGTITPVYGQNLRVNPIWRN